ncbi:MULTISPECIES: immunity protein Imm33 domain-containing protein [Sphingobacterium]|uniref:immunity protein Imm33 domain-containing protein n=1 Tax=Sphingobacterium TaxID=28453 RepID=UPI00257C96EA|nr:MULTISPECIES: hypothetical protein [Sphingobacterium]
MDNNYKEEQQEICIKYNQEFFETDLNLKIGISENFGSGEMPLNGLRHFPEGDTSGWYIWAGEYSEAADFFKPIHISHLFETFPEIVKYLGLPPGCRFLADNKGYEDIWFDQGLLVYDTQRS